MKKIIRLTETQLEDIIRKVIAEQDTEGTELWKDSAGVEYKLPGIKSNDDWSRYVNFGGSRYATAMKMLRNLGLRYKSGSMRPNPMDVGIRWNEVKKLDDPRAENADILMRNFQDGLAAIAQTGLQDTRGFKTPEFKNALAEQGNTKAADVERRYENYYDVLQKLGQYQMKFIKS